MDTGIKTVLVTGASRSLGRAIAHSFGRDGFHVGVAFHRRKEYAEETSQLIREAGGKATLLQFDVRDRSAIET